MTEYSVCYYYYYSYKGSRLVRKYGWIDILLLLVPQLMSVHPRVRGLGGYCMWDKLNRLYALGFKAWPLQLTKEIEFVTEKMHFPLNPLTSRHRHTNFLFEG